MMDTQSVSRSGEYMVNLAAKVLGAVQKFPRLVRPHDPYQ
jgi:hypothetical protein